MKTKLYIITFIGVAAVIIIFGYIGLNLSLGYMQDKYIELQLDVNKRQAENMAKLLEYQLNAGISKDSVRQNLQNAIAGTNSEKGFLCMFDKGEAKLICHPKKEMLGMKLPESFRYEKFEENKENKTVEVIKKGVGTGGLFKTPKSTEISYMVPVKGTDWMLSSHENIKMIKEEVNNQRKIFFIGFIILSIISAILATLMARQVGRRYEKTIEQQNDRLEDKNFELRMLNNELQQQKEEIEAQRDEIEAQKSKVEKQRDKIQHQNNQIKSSIQYASKIQQALLPPEKFIKESFKESFIYFKPKDIVSGDFYWYKRVNDLAVIAIADCTGHGVPGAFMSMLGISFLNEIVGSDIHDKICKNANIILNDLRQKVIDSLRQDDTKSTTKDGMDIAFILLDTNTNELQFAGAYNPLLIVRNNEIIEIPADRMPVGVHRKQENSFTNNNFQLQKNDSIYMFSDGYMDQFGGEKGRKFLKKRFLSLLLEINERNMDEQQEIIDTVLKKWKQNIDQVDDILVMGFKI